MASVESNWAATALAIAAFAAAGVYSAGIVHDWTRERIAANERARVVERLNSVIEPALRERDLTTARVSVSDALLSGSSAPIDVFVLFARGEPVATVFASVAPHGYNAAIDLLIGVSPGGAVTGVRAVRHRETRGLGDAIEATKSNWILQFDGKTLQSPEAPLWAVDQDEGAFDGISGATVTSRAVVGAVKNALLYFGEHRDELYARAAAAAAATDEP